MTIDLQPILSGSSVTLLPLREEDFESLYAVASDPLVWEQHPNKDRWKVDVFRKFFDGAMASGGAFKVVKNDTGRVLGSTRYYDHNEAERSILIGYTFYGRSSWGKGINPMVKKMMLDHIFKYVDTVMFHVGAVNLRSQIAIERLGAVKTGEEMVAYVSEDPKLNYVYVITKNESMSNKQYE
jgi:RimJ/RimL family protein N-acetyltransferase